MKISNKFLRQGFIEELNDSLKKKPWWIEIKTQTPRCTYYFGPFNSFREAQRHQPGYIKDLLEEKPLGVSVKLTQTQPTLLTIIEEEINEDEYNRLNHQSISSEEQHSSAPILC